MTIFRSFAPVSDSVVAAPVVTSTPLLLGKTFVPGTSVTLPPLLFNEPVATSIFAPDVRLRIVAAARLMLALTVMAPLPALPRFSVPAVTRSVSPADNSTVLAVLSNPEPRLIAKPLVFWRRETAAEPASMVAFGLGASLMVSRSEERRVGKE